MLTVKQEHQPQGLDGNDCYDQQGLQQTGLGMVLASARTQDFLCPCHLVEAAALAATLRTGSNKNRVSPSCCCS